MDTDCPAGQRSETLRILEQFSGAENEPARAPQAKQKWQPEKRIEIADGA
jgi:hypothetical protein